MKKVLIVLCISLLIFSCKKEENKDTKDFDGIAVENFKAEVPKAVKPFPEKNVFKIL